jgi:hypothetical protein
MGLVLYRAGSIVSAFQRKAGCDTRQKLRRFRGLLFTARSERSQLGVREVRLPYSAASASVVGDGGVVLSGGRHVISQ